MATAIEGASAHDLVPGSRESEPSPVFMPEAQKREATRLDQPPLLQIPPEIRNCIYELVMANRTIHISPEPFEFPASLSRLEKVIHRICLLDRPSSFPPGSPLAPDAHNHNDCWTSLVPKATRPSTMTPQDYSLSLGLLRTCKLIHKEAKLMPYAHNKFSFDCAGSFIIFQRMLSATQSLALTRISLGQGNHLRKFPSPIPIKLLINLNEVELHCSHPVRVSEKFMKELARLNLEKVTAIHLQVLSTAGSQRDPIVEEMFWEAREERIAEEQEELERLRAMSWKSPPAWYLEEKSKKTW